ncbi:MAG TPA: ABC transporter permease subunit [Caulobacteraceae bacterium]|jgi:NitT/TauT family transport system permease protein|nr:ABC transporter permease subunit [Caulobacteraceae bacterium]
MVFLSSDRLNAGLLARFARRELAPNRFDLMAMMLVGAIAVLVVHGVQQMSVPVSALSLQPVRLDPARLPEYALRSTLRMFAAIGCSLIFTFVVATLAAKSRKAELVIIPMLDIAQSIPIISFLAFTLTFFVNLFPRSELGVEFAAIFLVFTSQAWNMAFSFYQSLRTLPADLDEAARQFGLSAWQRFFKLELPFAVPALIWNTMMSMSGGWFFVVASEAFTVGKTSFMLPGIGSWLAVAIDHKDLAAVAMAVGAMAVVIVLYDQLIFRPIVAWADKFRFEQTASADEPQSWFLDLLRRTRLARRLARPALAVIRLLPRRSNRGRRLARPIAPQVAIWLDRVWFAAIGLAVLWAVLTIGRYLAGSLNLHDVLTAVGDGFLTLSRVAVLIVVATLIWTPIGVWIGLRPVWAQRVQALAQFLAAFPANVIFPFAVIGIVAWKLNPDIWLSPLIILGTQWYILFNVVAGASALPTDLREAAGIFHLRSWQRWRDFIIPGILPYYVTGALTASGGSWNASVVAEVVSWGHSTLAARGLGAFISKATAAGDIPRVALGATVMSVFVIVLNRSLWRPLYAFAERNFRLN